MKETDTGTGIKNIGFFVPVPVSPKCFLVIFAMLEMPPIAGIIVPITSISISVNSFEECLPLIFTAGFQKKESQKNSVPLL
jgi:hypothetical protein